MSNCVVRSRGSRLPCSIVADHGIEGGDHLSHDGDDNDFGLLVDRGETVVEDLEGGIVSGCAEGSHVEDVTDRHSAAVDAAMSFELATVEVVRRKSDKGSDLLAADLTELWQESDQGEGQRRTHAAHRGQQFIALRENGRSLYTRSTGRGPSGFRAGFTNRQPRCSQLDCSQSVLSSLGPPSRHTFVRRERSARWSWRVDKMKHSEIHSILVGKLR